MPGAPCRRPGIMRLAADGSMVIERSWLDSSLGSCSLPSKASARAAKEVHGLVEVLLSGLVKVVVMRRVGRWAGMMTICFPVLSITAMGLVGSAIQDPIDGPLRLVFVLGGVLRTGVDTGVGAARWWMEEEE